MSRFDQLKETLDKEFFHLEDHPDLDGDQKVARVINVCSASAAAIAIQPVPMADFALQLPVLGYMGYKIGRIRGVDVREHDADRLVGEMLATVGMGFAGRQLVIGLYKTVVPFWGAVTTFPLVYALVYATGKVMDYYFKATANGEEVDRDELKRVFERAEKEGAAKGKKAQKDRDLEALKKVAMRGKKAEEKAEKKTAKKAKKKADEKADEKAAEKAEKKAPKKADKKVAEKAEKKAPKTAAPKKKAPKKKAPRKQAKKDEDA